MIYAGVGLLTAASVYGVVDYYNARKQGAFNHLYKDEDVTVVKKIALPANTKTTAINSDSATASTNNTDEIKLAANHVKRHIRLEDFSRGRIAFVKPRVIKDSEVGNNGDRRINEEPDSAMVIVDTARSN